MSVITKTVLDGLKSLWIGKTLVVAKYGTDTFDAECKKLWCQRAAVNEEECDRLIQGSLPSLLDPYNEYAVFNADETGYF